jgi:hypothetical protein
MWEARKYPFYDIVPIDRLVPIMRPCLSYTFAWSSSEFILKARLHGRFFCRDFSCDFLLLEDVKE